MNLPENTIESSRPRRRLISLHWLALVFIVGIVEAINAQYEPVNHWSRMALATLGVLASIVWVPLIIYGAFVSWRNPDRRRQQARRIICFVVAFFALHALLMATQTMPAIHADRLVKAAEQFKAEHGYCPTSLKEMGIQEDFDHGQSRGYKGIAYYDGAVFYPGIFPFSMNMYQCPGGPWTYSTD
jgi:hypothetical protein